MEKKNSMELLGKKRSPPGSRSPLKSPRKSPLKTKKRRKKAERHTHHKFRRIFTTSNSFLLESCKKFIKKIRNSF